MVDGFYSIFFTGVSGVGLGMLVLRNGTITGADAAGGIYDGSYQLTNQNIIDGSVTLTMPAGGQLVTGATAGSLPASWEIPINLPSDLGDGQTLPINTPTGKVHVIFKKVRGF